MVLKYERRCFRYLYKEVDYMPNRQMEKYPLSLIIQKMIIWLRYCTHRVLELHNTDQYAIPNTTNGPDSTALPKVIPEHYANKN